MHHSGPHLADAWFGCRLGHAWRYRTVVVQGRSLMIVKIQKISVGFGVGFPSYAVVTH